MNKFFGSFVFITALLSTSACGDREVFAPFAPNGATSMEPLPWYKEVGDSVSACVGRKQAVRFADLSWSMVPGVHFFNTPNGDAYGVSSGRTITLAGVLIGERWLVAHELAHEYFAMKDVDHLDELWKRCEKYFCTLPNESWSVMSRKCVMG